MSQTLLPLRGRRSIRPVGAQVQEPALGFSDLGLRVQGARATNVGVVRLPAWLSVSVSVSASVSVSVSGTSCSS